MHKLARHFEELLSSILPPKERLAQAQTLTAQVREYLESSNGIDTTAPHTQLTGSYPRSTAIASVLDMKDVDFLVFIDPSYREEKPSVVLRRLRDTLEGYPLAYQVNLTTQRRSIHLHLEGYDFHLDIVPAIAAEGTENPLQVPDRIQQQWINSHPLGYGTSLSAMNQDNFGKVTKLIRLFKHWRDFHMQIMRPKSYWLSSLIYHLVSEEKLTFPGVSFAELFRDLVVEVQERFDSSLQQTNGVPSIKDPMLGNELTRGYWARSHFETFMRRLNETVSWANRALEDDIEQEEVIALWKKIFGDDWFPDTVEQTLPRSVAPTGRIGFSRDSGTEIPQHKYYGQE